MVAGERPLRLGPAIERSAALRRLLTAWFEGDVDQFCELAADDVTVRIQSAPELEGNYQGRPGAAAFAAKLAQLGVASATVEIEDIVADERYAAAVVRSVYAGGGQTLELVHACACTVDSSGKVSAIWTLS